MSSTAPDSSTRVDLQAALRDQLGGLAVQTRQMGGTSVMPVRGGPEDANKVLIDGVPINDIGGVADFLTCRRML